MSDLWIASGNEGKIRELRRLLEPLGLTLRRPGEAPEPVELIEDGPDFAANAAGKATTLARAVGAAALADDSGLCVDALGGRPGVRSARYGGPTATDAERVARLLAELEGVPAEARTARFVCHVCLADPRGGVAARFEGVCEGAILDAPRGAGGFGYDPVFVARVHMDRQRPRSFAELPEAEKDAVSHRGAALRRLVEHLRAHGIPT